MVRPGVQFNGWLILAVLVPLAGYTQSALRGKVTDGKSGEPVPFANVFFSHTTMGSPTLENGTFEIKNIPNGKYDLTVSVVGYKRFHESMEFEGTDLELLIVLEQDPGNLSEVIIYADHSDYKKYLPVFRKYFLGESINSVQCAIANPTDIFLYYDAKTDVLTGHASKPIVVANVRLGYRIHYILDLFEVNFKTGVKTLRGIPRFEELPLERERTQKQWDKRRNVAYHGSLTHFMRALYNGSVEKEGFRVTRVDSVDLAHYGGNGVKEYPINVGEHISGTTVKSFRFKGILKVVYREEAEEYGYRRSFSLRPGNFQESLLKFTTDRINIFENGYYLDQLSVFLDGYLSWSETIGELLPRSYYPSIEK